MVEYNCAVDDPDTPFSHVAFRWDTELDGWAFLCAGRTPEEFQRRVRHWIGNGIDPAIIKQYACQPITDVPPQAEPQAEPQPVEGESWGEWVGRLRAAKHRITTETMGNPQIQACAAPSPQPQPISDELWAVIKDRRPGAYETLQRHGVCRVIMTVGTSRTKLEFPTCTYMSPALPGWGQFDRDAMNPDRPIIVLDGTPESGFKPLPGLRGLAGLT